MRIRPPLPRLTARQVKRGGARSHPLNVFRHRQLVEALGAHLRQELAEWGLGADRARERTAVELALVAHHPTVDVVHELIPGCVPVDS
jgi:hypothetical protein